ncbi:MAG: hypothetical protein WD273_03595 [Trueperaceae bacterium]
MVQEINPAESIEGMSNMQLGELMAKCQGVISEGEACIEDFEAFVLCQRELSRRTWA